MVTLKEHQNVPHYPTDIVKNRQFSPDTLHRYWKSSWVQGGIIVYWLEIYLPPDPSSELDLCRDILKENRKISLFKKKWKIYNVSSNLSEPHKKYTDAQRQL